MESCNGLTATEAAGLEGLAGEGVQLLWLALLRYYSKGPLTRVIRLTDSDVREVRLEYRKEFWRLAVKDGGSGSDLFWQSLYALSSGKLSRRVEAQTGEQLIRLSTRGAGVAAVRPQCDAGW